MPEMPDDVEEVVITWLNTVFPAAMSRKTGAAFPSIVVRHIDGKEDVDCGTADLLVSVRIFSDKKLGEDAAATNCRAVHLKMLELAREHPDVLLASVGRNASIDYVKVALSPRWLEFKDDQVLVKISRYQIGLNYAPA